MCITASNLLLPDLTIVRHHIHPALPHPTPTTAPITMGNSYNVGVLPAFRKCQFEPRTKSTAARNQMCLMSLEHLEPLVLVPTASTRNSKWKGNMPAISDQIRLKVQLHPMLTTFSSTSRRAFHANTYARAFQSMTVAPSLYMTS